MTQIRTLQPKPVDGGTSEPHVVWDCNFGLPSGGNVQLFVKYTWINNMYGKI